MNRLAHSFDLPVKGNPPGFSVNDNFIVFHYWADSLAGGNYLEHASGFNSTTIYIRHSSNLPMPVRIPCKTGVNLKNDHDGSLKNISLSTAGSEVFNLEEIPPRKIVRLEFARKGLYRLRYEFVESGTDKEESVDIVIG